jgi:hypothetical protein
VNISPMLGKTQSFRKLVIVTPFAPKSGFGLLVGWCGLLTPLEQALPDAVRAIGYCFSYMPMDLFCSRRIRLLCRPIGGWLETTETNLVCIAPDWCL